MRYGLRPTWVYIQLTSFAILSTLTIMCSMKIIKLTKLWVIRLGILVLLIPMLVLVAFEAKYWRRVYPGVTIAGTDVGGLTRNEAEAKLKKKTDGLKTLLLGWGVNQWSVSRDQLGLKYDLEASVRRAWEVGRQGKGIENLKQKFDAGRNGVRFELIYKWDGGNVAAAISTVAGQIDLPAKEPEITLDKVSGQVLVTSGENGFSVNRAALEKKMDKAIKTASQGRIDVPIIRLLPKLTSDEMATIKDRGQKLVGKKLVLTATEEGKEHLQTVLERSRFDDDIKCIMCACCVSSCPVNQKEDPAYVGPAALVRAHRYIFDSRVKDTLERLAIMDKPHGAWSCKSYYKCTQVCPKEIQITKRILEVKRRILDELRLKR